MQHTYLTFACLKAMAPSTSSTSYTSSHNPTGNRQPAAPIYMRRVHALPQLRAVVARLHAKRTAPRANVVMNALQCRLARAKNNTRSGTSMSPFDRMNHCRTALERLDANGWKRSYLQRLFHEDFLVLFCFLDAF